MYESEINGFDWIISPKLSILIVRLQRMDSYECENHINIMRRGPFEDEAPMAVIDCSYQRDITRYRKSKLFTLTEITVSSKNIDKDLGRYILAIKGHMVPKGITIRKVPAAPRSSKISPNFHR